ncbi:Zinc finger protein 77 [Amphibalanus amphitrite]|uniref:Zinc finger protein 77 n=1 Tax=Amphibalanus amphitrite TaxID=1232801 RepID=A0A6A4VB38_AMPAM|nr:Zinc finger protein 77 [Amphibalanus amphitrite]
MKAHGVSIHAAELPQLSALDAHGRLVCTLCGRSYRSRDSFRHHVETHAGKTTCPHCQQTFATASNRSRHAQTCRCRPAGPAPAGHWRPQRLGVGGLPLPLPLWSPPTTTASLACDRCGRTYASRDSLRHHLETHEGKTLCSFCGKRFATISSRNHHVRSVHAEAPPSVHDARH